MYRCLLPSQRLILGKTNIEFDWSDTRACLLRLLGKAVEYCLKDQRLQDDVASWYMSSDLEKELDLGVLRAFDPAANCQVFMRDIVDLRNYTTHDMAERFIELKWNEQDEKFQVGVYALTFRFKRVEKRYTRSGTDMSVY